MRFLEAGLIVGRTMVEKVGLAILPNGLLSSGLLSNGLTIEWVYYRVSLLPSVAYPKPLSQQRLTNRETEVVE